MRRPNGRRSGACGIAGLLGSLALLLTPSRAAQQPPTHRDDYIGAEVCSDCHYTYFLQFSKTSMAVLLSDKYPIGQRGCEACHGPGRAHAEAEKAKKEGAVTLIRQSPKEYVARCLVCHRKDEKRILFARSSHMTAGVTCIDCHNSHRLDTGSEAVKPAGPLESYFPVPARKAERDWLDNRLLKEKQPQLCYNCHHDIQSQFQLPVRHRVDEGLVKCTDCHNPHGSLTAPELLAVNSEVCYTCHVEKRGPFVYEHAPVRVEGCVACHTAHGSINTHLLKRRQARQLCLECHAEPHAINVPHPRLGFQAAGECTRCHFDIHGSNYQPQFLR
jgi:predicted CXXCH cytochrome family protein